MNFTGYISICLAVIVGMVIVFCLFAHEAHQRDAMTENIGRMADHLKQAGGSIEQARIAFDSIMGLPKSILVSPDDHSYIRVHYATYYADAGYDLKLFFKDDRCYDFILSRTK